MEKMRSLVEVLIVREHPGIHLSVSIGGAYGTGKTTELIKIADDMMYQSKITKNQVNICFLDQEAKGF